MVTLLGQQVGNGFQEKQLRLRNGFREYGNGLQYVVQNNTLRGRDVFYIIQKELEHVDHRVAAPRYNGNCAYIEGLE